jgi:predicted GIY-YIG superfamily endonuclease
VAPQTIGTNPRIISKEFIMYYIYHIEERRKIGVSVDVERRMTEHEWNGDYEILEEHTCIKEVSRRERELQKNTVMKLTGYLIRKWFIFHH